MGEANVGLYLPPYPLYIEQQQQQQQQQQKGDGGFINGRSVSVCVSVCRCVSLSIKAAQRDRKNRTEYKRLTNFKDAEGQSEAAGFDYFNTYRSMCVCVCVCVCVCECVSVCV